MSSNNINRVEQSRRSKLSPVTTSSLVKFTGLMFAVGTSTGLTTLTTAAWSFTADTFLVQFATAIPAVAFALLTSAFYLMMVLSLIELVDRVTVDRFGS
jgi:hypothetical protein